MRQCVGTFVFCIFIVFPLFALTLNDNEIASYQGEMADKPIGERIAFWAERFVGTPYDTDPSGEYVTRRVIVADERVDCMYLSFRAVELALGRTPSEAIEVALDKRFLTKGVLRNGTVSNYDERFQYGEDMLDSMKWGREITGEIGPLTSVKGSRGREKVMMVSKETLIELLKEQTENPSGKTKGLPLRSGDFIFFIKPPEKRVAEEIVGHIGIIKREGRDIYLIHASGRKNHGNPRMLKSLRGVGNGEVKKVLFDDYARSMPFSGIRVSRFD